MNNNEFAIMITLFIFVCLLFIALAIAAFYVGFCIGDSNNRKSEFPAQKNTSKNQSKKRKPPDFEYEKKVGAVNELLAKVDAYDGKAPVVKKDGDRV